MLRLHKKYSKFILVAGNTLRNLGLPFFSMLASVMVVRLGGKELWGQMVSLILFSGIALQFLGWGNKEFLLRKASLQPALLYTTWFNFLSTRALLCLPLMVVITFYPAGLFVKIVLFCWCMLRFIYLSYDVFIAWNKKFLLQFYAELSGFAFLALPVFLLRDNMEIRDLLLAFFISDLVKFLVVAFFSDKNYLSSFSIKIKTGLFRESFLFFLLGITAFLNSRMDLVVVKLRFTDADVATYQVITSMFIYLQSFANYIFYPFQKNIYRLHDVLTRRLAAKVFVPGIFISLAGAFCVKIFVHYVYGFEATYTMVIAGFISALCFYIITPSAYILFKYNQIKKIIWVCATGMVVNAVFSYFLSVAMGLNGAIVSNTITHIVSAYIFWYLSLRAGRPPS